MITVNAIYPAFQGEVNPFGIGHPCVFLRLAGCHLRCYLSTLGKLCDTPESLEGHQGKQFSCEEAVAFVQLEFMNAGIDGDRIKKVVCLSGGDPLFRSKVEVHRLLELLFEAGIHTCVETSGTLDHTPYLMCKNVYWIFDWKLKSCGVAPTILDKKYNLLREVDYVKFVVYDEEDFKEMTYAIQFLLENKCRAVIAVGAYWGGKLEPMEIFELLKFHKLLGKVVMNFQAHKMCVSSDYTKTIPEKI